MTFFFPFFLFSTHYQLEGLNILLEPLIAAAYRYALFDVDFILSIEYAFKLIKLVMHVIGQMITHLLKFQDNSCSLFTKYVTLLNSWLQFLL